MQKPAEEQQPESAMETAAVEQRRCASQEVLEEQMAADPQRRRFLEDLERKTERYKGRERVPSVRPENYTYRFMFI